MEALTGSLREVWEIAALSLSEKLQQDPVPLYYEQKPKPIGCGEQGFLEGMLQIHMEQVHLEALDI